MTLYWLYIYVLTYFTFVQGKTKGGDGSSVQELTPPPTFIQDRLDLWDKLKKEQDELLASKTPEPIQVLVLC